MTRRGESVGGMPPHLAGVWPAGWGWVLIVAVIVGMVEPVVGAVQRGAEPSIGHWPAYALSLLAAAAVAVPIFAAASWVLRHERSGRPNDPAAMVYRPALLPVGAFVGAVLKDLPKSLTEWAAWGYLGCLAVLLAGAVLVQWRDRRAWSWWAAVPAGFVIALAALLGAAAVAQVVAPREVRPGAAKSAGN